MNTHIVTRSESNIGFFTETAILTECEVGSTPFCQAKLRSPNPAGQSENFGKKISELNGVVEWQSYSGQFSSAEMVCNGLQPSAIIASRMACNPATMQCNQSNRGPLTKYSKNKGISGQRKSICVSVVFRYAV